MDDLEIPDFLDRRNRPNADGKGSMPQCKPPHTSRQRQAPHPDAHVENRPPEHKAQHGTKVGVQAEHEPWPEPVEDAHLVSELVAVLNRHLALPDGAAEAISLWVLFTHTFEIAEVSPRLALLSPVPECGKTTVFLLLNGLVPRPMLASNLSPAVVFRAIDRDRPTLLMDEADTYIEERDDFRGILNSGHTPAAAIVWRADGDKYEPKRFSTWAPIAIAKIGKLPDTLASRSIIIPMRRKRPDEMVIRFRPHIDGPALNELKRKCIRWSTDSLDRMRGADPRMPDQLSNRSADNWRPLLAIADVLGGDWPDKARRIAVVLTGEETEPPGQELLADIREIFARLNIDRIPSRELCNELTWIEGRPWATLNKGAGLSQNQLANMLDPFRIRPRSIRTGPNATPKGYLRKHFEDAFARYLKKDRNTATIEEI